MEYQSIDRQLAEGKQRLLDCHAAKDQQDQRWSGLLSQCGLPLQLSGEQVKRWLAAKQSLTIHENKWTQVQGHCAKLFHYRQDYLQHIRKIMSTFAGVEGSAILGGNVGDWLAESCLADLQSWSQEDDRSLAALEIFAELGEMTQVIVFTHHEYLLGLMNQRMDQAKFRTHRLQSGFANATNDG